MYSAFMTCNKRLETIFRFFGNDYYFDPANKLRGEKYEVYLSSMSI